jgi:hypothetical protein
VCIKYSKKGYYIREYRNTTQGKSLGFKNKSILKNNNRIKGIYYGPRDTSGINNKTIKARP